MDTLVKIMLFMLLLNALKSVKLKKDLKLMICILLLVLIEKKKYNKFSQRLTEKQWFTLKLREEFRNACTQDELRKLCSKFSKYIKNVFLQLFLIFFLTLNLNLIQVFLNKINLKCLLINSIWKQFTQF